ncbi:MAG: transglutaminase domain-containing protein, partial [Proteobacteria bacterium]|nr:transglutaminase domain-containing protein [Pseudomonadota bacterium]
MEPADTIAAGPIFHGEKPLSQMETVFLDPKESKKPKKITYPQTTLAVPGGRANLEILVAAIEHITGHETLDPRQFSVRAVDYLRSQHGYSLNISIPPGEADELVRWLDSSEPGHCELFAGSFTLLARLAGIPTRIVTGFQGGTWSGFENYYMVRNRDAHAWCEVYDGKGTWFRVDPTPGSGRLGDTADSAFSQNRLRVDTSWSAYFDSLRILWYRRIVNFDKDQQDEMTNKFKKVGVETMNILKLLIKDRLDALKTWFVQPWSRGHWMRIGFLMLVTTVFYLLIRYIGWWLPIIYREAKFFGLDLKSDPIRKKAGKLVVRFRAQAQAKTLSDIEGLRPEDWMRIYQQ